MVSAEFEAAAEAAKNLKQTPNDDELLQLYGLYKQATVGDNETEKPSAFNFKAKYKWQAWTDVIGTPKDEAEQKYIELVESMKQKYGLKE